MANGVIAGQLSRLQVDGVDFDPVGNWTIRQSRIKREHLESTKRGHKFRETRIPGMLSGQVAIDNIEDAQALMAADDVQVQVETANRIPFNGTMTYTADGDLDTNEGQLQVELTGELNPG